MDAPCLPGPASTMQPQPQVPQPTLASPSDFEIYHSEGDDQPIGHRSLGKKKAIDGQNAEVPPGKRNLMSVDSVHYLLMLLWM